jgi:hypothetical protein
MNTNKGEKLRNEIPISGSVKDNNESNHDYQTRIVRAQLSGQTITDSIDFNILLIDPSFGITEFHRSFFTI